MSACFAAELQVWDAIDAAVDSEARILVLLRSSLLGIQRDDIACINIKAKSARRVHGKIWVRLL